MRISRLAEEAGLPLATVKYYLREGLLHPGHATSATQARYDESHVRRLRLVRALTGPVGMSVAQVRSLLEIIDDPGNDLFEALGRAISTLPPAVDVAAGGGAGAADATGTDVYPRAHAVIESLGQVYDPRFTAVAQLEEALRGAEEAGMPMSEERLAVYGRLLRELARFDVEHIPRGSDEVSVEYAALGTALYEPVILALRRLAHQDVAARALGNPAG
jgi:DNA-binding transcriptional MerR regulator